MVPSDEALQADLDRETDPKAKNMKLADLVDLSVLREIEKSGFLLELYGKGAPARAEIQFILAKDCLGRLVSTRNG